VAGSGPHWVGRTCRPLEVMVGSAVQDLRETVRRERVREIALFRFGVIQDALDPGLTAKQRGRLVRSIAQGVHPGPSGVPVRVSRANLDRWLRAYRTGGFTALMPVPRRVASAIPAEVLELAIALKKEAPGRTAAQIATILAAHSGWAPAERTLQRHLADAGLSRTRPDGSVPAAFGRFEAEQPNVRWVGDCLHGPVVAGRKAILTAFLDDHSRLVTAARWGYHENAMALRETLRVGLASRGCPKVLYVDNGSMFIDASLRRTCAVIGAKLTHSQAGRPQGRGKIERFFRTVRGQFLIEINDTVAETGTGVSSLAELNSLFDAWVHQVYHQRVHSETDQTPLQRFLAAGAPAPVPGDVLAEAFRWGEWRTVTSTAQVNLHGNLYDVDPSLVGTRVELVFDPTDLDDIDVRAHSKSYGKAVPSRIRRHVHPKAQAEPAPAPVRTGIDYLRLIEARHTRSLQSRLRYAHLDEATAPAGPSPAPAPAPAQGPQAAPGTPAGTTGPPQPQVHTADRPDDPAGPGDGADETMSYDTDLLALAAQAEGTDPVLEAELADFAALLTSHRTGPGASTEPDTTPGTQGDTEPGGEHDGAQEAS
jgi:putative transposase